MDEPCSALDPIATGRIEDLMQDIKSEYTIVIVTHNMQQAARVSDRTAFYSVLRDETSDIRTGVLVEYDRTEKIFHSPRDSRTQAYVTGRMGCDSLGSGWGARTLASRCRARLGRPLGGRC